VVSVLRKPPSSGQQQQQANGSEAAAAAAEPVDDAAGNYIIDTLLPVAAGSIKDGQPRPAPIGLAAAGNKSSSSSNGTVNNAAAGANDGKKGGKTKGGKAAADGQEQQPAAEMAVLPVSLTLVTGISVLRVGLPDDLRPFEARQSLLCVLQVSEIPCVFQCLFCVMKSCSVCRGLAKLIVSLGAVTCCHQPGQVRLYAWCLHAQSLLLCYDLLEILLFCAATAAGHGQPLPWRPTASGPRGGHGHHRCVMWSRCVRAIFAPNSV
jgi:hypothetical protein